jgi:hypothetical protein
LFAATFPSLKAGKFSILKTPMSFMLLKGSRSQWLSGKPLGPLSTRAYHSSQGPHLGASAALASKPSNDDSSSSGGSGRNRGRKSNTTNQRPHKNKSTSDLLNSYLVFKLCGVSPLVSATPTLIETAKKLNLTKPLYCGIKNTFFKHFCGESVLLLMEPFR